MSAIQINHLSKSFGNFKAVDDLSFSVAPKRVFGFLGPNGAGKTTTIRMMVGLSRPSSGEIEIAGHSVNFGRPDANRALGYLPEQPSFYTWMNAVEYLDFVGSLFALDADTRKSRIAQLLDLVGLTDARKRKIGSYSNGMKQRLGIAQALMGDPPVLILDEPVSALDPIGRREVLNIIETLKKDKTIFMSTHILSDVDRICDDVAILDKGKLITIAPLSELKNRYAKPILQIEFDQDPEILLGDLNRQSWLVRIEKNGLHLKLWVSDVNIVNQNIPLKFLAEHNIGVMRYSLSMPETEDLFVEIIENHD